MSADSARVLALTRYGPLGASSRMRFMQFLPALQAYGLTLEVSPLMPDAYVAALQHGERPRGMALAAYWQRLVALRGSQAGVLWVEKELFPWVPGPVEVLAWPRRTPVVLDYDDAVFHQADQHANPVVRRLLGGKHAGLMRRAAAVVAGNEYLAAYARAAGAHRVEVLPTVVDLGRYPTPTPRAQATPVPVVGWVGQASTATYLQDIAPVLRQLQAEGVLKAQAIGIEAERLGLPMQGVPWSADTEAQRIAGFDMGIMPLRDSPFERGKCGYKLIQYMACGLPVVASPVGVNRQLVEPGVNGFLAETPADWAQALRALAADPALRARMGAAGRAKVERHYSTAVVAPRLAALLHQVAADAAATPRGR